MSCDIQVYERVNDLTIVGKFSEPIQSSVKYFAASPPDSELVSTDLAYLSLIRDKLSKTLQISMSSTDKNNMFQISIMKPALLLHC